MSLEMAMVSVRAGTHSKRWREGIPNFRSCKAEAAGIK